MGRHASNAVCVSKPDLYSEKERPSDTRDFCHRLGIRLPDEELAAAVMAVATNEQPDEVDFPDSD